MGSSVRLRLLELPENCIELPLFRRSPDLAELYQDGADDDKMSQTKFIAYKHEEHDVFVEQHMLADFEDTLCWRQIGRWVKYEETLEDTETRWGKPHVPTINFHSFLHLRRSLEAGLLLLDVECRDMNSLIDTLIDGWTTKNLVDPADISLIEQILCLRHKHVVESEKAWKFLEQEYKKSMSTMNLQPTPETFSIDDLKGMKKLSGLLRRLPRGRECGLVLVGRHDKLKNVAMAFVRLSVGIHLPGITEIPIGVRFVFIMLGPGICDFNYVEVGRCMAVLLTTSIFRHIAYGAKDRREILLSLNEFMDASIVIPHGDWDYELFHIHELRKTQLRIYERKLRNSLELPGDQGDLIQLQVKEELNPFIRTRRPFGGAWNDIRKRFSVYPSDFKDAFNIQCAATAIFLYFACVAGGVALGEVLRANTHDYVGVPETLVGASIGGTLFALLSTQPLIVLGTTGSTLVFDLSLYNFLGTQGMTEIFLPIRVWIGIWMIVIALIVVGAEGSVLMRHFTRFTQEIYAVFISIIFIHESFRACLLAFIDLSGKRNKTINESGTFYTKVALLLATFTLAMMLKVFKDSTYGTKLIRKLIGNFGVIISIALFSGLAYLTTPFDPIGNNLQIPDALTSGIHTTLYPNDSHIRSVKGWIVDPTHLPMEWIFGAILPAALLFVLIFLEMSIGELIMSRKEAMTRKGKGFHWDVLLICIINGLMGTIGSTWLSSATVRSVSHLAALTVYSTNNPPGEKPTILGVREQRVTFLIASILLGVSVVMGMVLKYVPMSVLFGVFLFMGVSALRGIQFIDRIYLFFKQIDKHPELPYVKRVRTLKMHVYTTIQIVSVVLIMTIKESPASLVLPVFFVVLIPFRKYVLSRFYDDDELDALDGQSPVVVVVPGQLKINVSSHRYESELRSRTGSQDSEDVSGESIHISTNNQKTK